MLAVSVSTLLRPFPERSPPLLSSPPASVWRVSSLSFLISNSPQSPGFLTLSHRDTPIASSNSCLFLCPFPLEIFSASIPGLGAEVSTEALPVPGMWGWEGETTERLRPGCNTLLSAFISPTPPSSPSSSLHSPHACVAFSDSYFWARGWAPLCSAGEVAGLIGCCAKQVSGEFPLN